MAIHRGKLDEGRAYLEETLALDLKAGVPAGIATSRVNLAAVLVRTGLVSEARDMVRAALPVFADLGDPDGVAECLERLVEIAAASGDSVGAIRFLSAATAIREREGVPLRDIDRVETDLIAAAAEESLDATVLQEARAEGAAMDVDAAVAFAAQATTALLGPGP